MSSCWVPFMRLSFSNPQGQTYTILVFGDNWYIGMYRPDHRILWQSGLSSFQRRDKKLARFCQYNFLLFFTKLDRFCQYHLLLFFFIFDQKYIRISLYPSVGNLSTQIAQIIEYDLWFWILPYRDKINRTENILAYSIISWLLTSIFFFVRG